MTTTLSSVPLRANSASRFYAIAWRWHFYAGLYVVPFLVMLSLTGLAMVFFTGFQTRLGMAVHVVPQSQVQAVSAQAKSALAAIPGGTLNEYIAPPPASSPAGLRSRTAVPPRWWRLIRTPPKCARWSTKITRCLPGPTKFTAPC